MAALSAQPLFKSQLVTSNVLKIVSRFIRAKSTRMPPSKKYNVCQYCQAKVLAGKMQSHLTQYHKFSTQALKRRNDAGEGGLVAKRKKPVISLVPAYSDSESESGKWYLFDACDQISMPLCV
jgi:hypothetical protein